MTCVVLPFSMHCKVINIWANIKYKDALLNVFCFCSVQSIERVI